MSMRFIINNETVEAPPEIAAGTDEEIEKWVKEQQGSKTEEKPKSRHNKPVSTGGSE